MNKKSISATFVMILFALSACIAPPAPTLIPLPIQAQSTPLLLSQPTDSPTPTATLSPQPSSSPTLGQPMLTLTADSPCQRGPAANYTSVLSFPAGSVLPILGTNGAGWWLVRINDPGTPLTECWINGGTPSGDTGSLPMPTSLPAASAHDPQNWTNVVYLTCAELNGYDWTWNGASSGEYASLVPIFGITRATIIQPEYSLACPGFSPRLKAPVHNKDNGTVLGYLTCTDLAAVSWYWNIPGGGWIGSTALFGSSRATYDTNELSMNCPSLTPTKVVPVHNPNRTIIGFLGCSELGKYLWGFGAANGEYIAVGSLFNSTKATIYSSEYGPACPSFTLTVKG